jgi:hypothetical protein
VSAFVQVKHPLKNQAAGDRACCINFLSKSFARLPVFVINPSLNHLKCSAQNSARSGFLPQPSAKHAPPRLGVAAAAVAVFSAFATKTLLELLGLSIPTSMSLAFMIAVSKLKSNWTKTRQFAPLADSPVARRRFLRTEHLVGKVKNEYQEGTCVLRIFALSILVVLAFHSTRADNGEKDLDFTKYTPQGINLTDEYFKLLESNPQIPNDYKKMKVILIEGIMANYVEVAGKYFCLCDVGA